MRSNRYSIVLSIVAFAILAPGAVAQLGGAPVEALASVAWYEVLAGLALLLTSPISLALGLRSLFRKAWSKALIWTFDMLIPIATLSLIPLVNGPGFDKWQQW